MIWARALTSTGFFFFFQPTLWPTTSRPAYFNRLKIKFLCPVLWWKIVKEKWKMCNLYGRFLDGTFLFNVGIYWSIFNIGIQSYALLRVLQKSQFHLAFPSSKIVVGFTFKVQTRKHILSTWPMYQYKKLAMLLTPQFYWTNIMYLRHWSGTKFYIPR